MTKEFAPDYPSSGVSDVVVSLLALVHPNYSSPGARHHQSLTCYSQLYKNCGYKKYNIIYPPTLLHKEQNYVQIYNLSIAI